MKGKVNNHVKAGERALLIERRAGTKAVGSLSV